MSLKLSYDFRMTNRTLKTFLEDSERKGLVQVGGEAGKGGRKVYIGRGFSGVLGVIHGGGSRYVLGLIILETAGTADWSWTCKGCHSPIWTWTSFKIPSLQTGSTPAGRTDTSSLLQTRQADTAAGLQCSTVRHHDMRWRPSNSSGQTLSAFSW